MLLSFRVLQRCFWHNKLACFSPACMFSLFWYFRVRPGAYQLVYFTRVGSASLANIGLFWKGKQGPNTLAYFRQLTGKQSFTTSPPEQQNQQQNSVTASAATGVTHDGDVKVDDFNVVTDVGVAVVLPVVTDAHPAAFSGREPSHPEQVGQAWFYFWPASIKANKYLRYWKRPKYFSNKWNGMVQNWIETKLWALKTFRFRLWSTILGFDEIWV